MAQFSAFFKFRQSVFGLVLCLVAFLGTFLFSGVAFASGADCIRIHDEDYQEGDQHFTVISINGEAKNCQLRNAYRLVPVLGENQETLGMQDWLRSAYAANQGKRSTVKRGCIPLPNKQPPADATDEERQFCKDGLVNYFGIVSNGWRANILIPTTRWYTDHEMKAAVAKRACEVLRKVPNKSVEVYEALKECGKGKVIEQKREDANGDAVGMATIESLKLQLKELEDKLAEEQRKNAALVSKLAEASAHRPFQPNYWLAIAVVLGCLLIAVLAHDIWSRRVFMRRLVEAGLEIEDMRQTVEQAHRDIQGMDKLRFDLENSELRCAQSEARNEELKKANGLLESEKRAELDTHMLVVRKLRNEASEGMKGLHATIEQLNARSLKLESDLAEARKPQEFLKNMILGLETRLGEAGQKFVGLEEQNRLLSARVSELEQENIAQRGKIKEREEGLTYLVGELQSAYEELGVLSADESPVERERRVAGQQAVIKKMDSMRPPPAFEDKPTSTENKPTSTEISNVRQLRPRGTLQFPAVPDLREPYVPVESSAGSRKDDSQVLREGVSRIIEHLCGTRPKDVDAEDLIATAFEALAVAGR